MEIKLCPECKSKMIKNGIVFSGRKKVQRYLCSKCGRTSVK
jgi:transposase-like protein